MSSLDPSFPSGGDPTIDQTEQADSSASHSSQTGKRRGRRQNDALPPSRSRDVQRAFRARRAERLKYLESRIVELEAENDHLKAKLGIMVDEPGPSSRGGESAALPSPGLSSASTSAGGPSSRPTTAVPVHSLPEATASSHSWLPSSSLYGLPMHANQHGDLSGEAEEDEEIFDETGLIQFNDGLTGGRPFDSAPPRPGSASSASIPDDFVPSSVAWNNLAPYSSMGHLATREDANLLPSPAQLGDTIRRFISAPGQRPGAYVRQEGDHVLVSLAAVDHIVEHLRRSQPETPQMPDYAYSFARGMQSHPEDELSVPAHAPHPSHLDLFGIGGTFAGGN